MSLFSFLLCDLALALEQITGEIKVAEESQIPQELKDQAQFSCLKYAAVRLGNEHALRITQVKAPSADDKEQVWMVVGNKINQEEEDRPISFSCKMINNNLPLWDLVDFSLFQISKDSVDQMKDLQLKQNADATKNQTAPQASDDAIPPLLRNR